MLHSCRTESFTDCRVPTGPKRSFALICRSSSCPMQQMPNWTRCLRSTPRILARVRHTTPVPIIPYPLNSNAWLPFWVILSSTGHGAFSWTTYRESRILGHTVRCTFFCIPSRTHVNSFIVSKRDKLLPLLGSAHSSDLPYIYGGADLTDYLINFVANLNPNGPSLPYWPQYDTSSRQLLTLYDTPVATNITLDTFREEGTQFLTELLLANPL